MKIFNYFQEQKKSVPAKPTAEQKCAEIMLLICTASFIAAFVALATLEGGFRNVLSVTLFILTLVLAIPTLRLTLRALDTEAEQEGLATLIAFEKTEKKFGKKKTKAAVIKSKDETFKAKLEKWLKGTLVVTLFTFFGNTPIGIKVFIAICVFLGLALYYFTNDEQKAKDEFYRAGRIYFDVEEEEK